MKKIIIAFVVLVAIPALCSFGSAGQANVKMTAFVSIIPQAYFLERIGDSHIDINVLVGEGQSPHTYEPTPQQMARLSSAKAYFAIGVPFEKNLIRKIKQSHKQLFVVETQEGITFRRLENHRHGDGKKEHHGAVDPHIWMDPKLVKIQARNIHDALCRLDPGNADNYSANLKTFLSDLNDADKRIAAALAPYKGRNIFVFHPAFGYFADSYGLHQMAVEIEGKEPGAKHLASLIDKAKKEGVRVIFVQPQFSTKSAEVLAKAIGGAVVPINPLARDYIANLERIASAIEKGLVLDNQR